MAKKEEKTLLDDLEDITPNEDNDTGKTDTTDNSSDNDDVRVDDDSSIELSAEEAGGEDNDTPEPNIVDAYVDGDFETVQSLINKATVQAVANALEKGN